MTKSLRGRLLIAIVATLTGMLVLLDAGLYFAMRSVLQIDFDRLLVSRAQAVGSLVEQDRNHVRFNPDSQQLPEFEWPRVATHRVDYFQVWLDDGTSLVKSPSLGAGELLPAMPPAINDLREFRLPNGRNGRLVVVPFQPGIEHEESASGTWTGHSAVIAMARETHGMDLVLEHLRWQLLGLSCAVVLVGAITLWAVTLRAMRPLEDISRQIASIRAEELRTSISAGDCPSELLPVIDKINDLLARLEDAFARERGFSSDVAHELRTPLSGMIATLEVCRSRSREPEAYRAAIDKCLAILGPMQQMIESLLLLTRAEAGQLAIESHTVMLRAFLDECWIEFESRAEQRGLLLKWSVPDSIAINTDADKLRIVIRNLFDNAVSYAELGGKLEVTASTTADGTVLEVANTGSAVSALDTHKLAERFWRNDPSRTDVGAHCGLGLAIVNRVAKTIGVAITFATEREGWFRVRLVFSDTGAKPGD